MSGDPTGLNLRIGVSVPKCHHSYGQRCPRCCDDPMDFDETIIIVVPPTDFTPVRVEPAEHPDS